METNFSYEFNKLDKIDLKVACWLYSESPTELYGYLEYLAVQRYKFRGIDINVHKAFHQLAEVTINDALLVSQTYNSKCGQ